MNYLVCSEYSDAGVDMDVNQRDAETAFEAVILDHMQRCGVYRWEAIAYLHEQCYTVVVLELPALRHVPYSEWGTPWEHTWRLGQRITKLTAATKLLQPIVEAATVIDVLPDVRRAYDNALLELAEVTAEHTKHKAALEESMRPPVEGERCIDVTGQGATETVTA